MRLDPRPFGLEIMDNVDADKTKYERYFVNVAKKKGESVFLQKWGVVHPDDPYDRCIKCGETIDTHPSLADKQLLSQQRHTVDEHPAQQQQVARQSTPTTMLEGHIQSLSMVPTLNAKMDVLMQQQQQLQQQEQQQQLQQQLDAIEKAMAETQHPAQDSSQVQQTYTEYWDTKNCEETKGFDTESADDDVKNLWSELQGTFNSELQLQQVWNNHCSKLSTAETQLFDGSSTATVGAKKPGLVTCHPGVKKPNAACVWKVIELKAPTVSLVSKEVLGQVADVLTRILLAQSERGRATALLNNGKSVVLLRCSRKSSNTFGFSVTPVLTGETARDHVMHFLRCSEVEQVTVGAITSVKCCFLGQGAHCKAFSVQHGAAELVLKDYDNSNYAVAEVERLKQVFDFIDKGKCNMQCAKVPALVANDDNKVLVQPKGRYFRRDGNRRLRPHHVIQLINTLKIIHGKGIVHRDVRPANFFIHEGQALLNDWSDAVESQEDPIPHCGCPQVYCDFDTTTERVPQPSDDLYSLVLSIYAIIFHEKGELVKEFPSSLTQAFELMKDYARQTNYDELMGLAREVPK